MKILAITAALFLGLGAPTTTKAQSGPSAVSQVSGWEAVGRLTMANRAMCTGALIAPDMVLTAAHCVFDPKTGRKFKAKTITFEAGLTDSTAKATRDVDEVVLHPSYRHKHKGPNDPSVDIAVLMLKTPIDKPNPAIRH